MSKPKVRITKSTKPNSWYSDLIGEEFEVVPYWSDLYAVEEDVIGTDNYKIRAINMDDCEVIDE